MRSSRLLAVLLALTLLGAACGDGDEDEASTTTAGGATTTAAPPAGSNVTTHGTIKDFTLPTLTVAAGATVTITNADSAPHTFSAKDGSFGTEQIDGGGTGEFTAPATVGTYDVFCEVHSSMTGTLTVV